MQDRFDFDGVLKELLQQDQPGLLARLTGGVAVREFLNVELPKVQERRVDLVLLLVDGTILHVEIQSTNDPGIKFRMVVYYALIKQAYKRPVRQVVLYVGQSPMTMPDRLEEDGNQLRYGLIDVRSFRAEELMASGSAADLALALLGQDGAQQLPAILRKAAKLKGIARDRVLAQILVLSGLRGIAGKVEWELNSMGVVIDITKNPVLMRWEQEAIAKGKAEGRARAVRELLEIKFGPLPKWADERLTKASESQLQRWTKKIIAASSLEGVLGRR